ncbi:MAG TPA: bifunctional 5,10-methylenetetrahydrofolate dehydrogenase/5,10-methenyltetrahydrofolate cyclohydrolase [Patescibacteria group bacterium]|jgi:methylenetetrahydrofolate dehydrogenase (NADP+)/methenyltetrahydrofolate cyclohydrolase|nr:bifunctional 5,10-methylenetetrahydrofolate dehydrogenase/5,10-methenyltetrahydrofolate cyclohydrolase [Patescibacteria group bacterium]
MILDGRTVANHLLAELIIRVDALAEKGIMPHLAVVMVGENPETVSYVLQKEKRAKEIGTLVSVYKHPENISQEKLKETIDFLQKNGDIHGIILQLPIPKNLNEQKLINSIDPKKDVDGFTPNSPFTVPIAAAIMKLLEVPMIKETITTGESFNEWLLSKHIVVMGKGTTGGTPIIKEFQNRGVEPTVIDSQTKNPEDIAKKADIIITAVGKPGVLTKDMIKKDVILLNVGMTRGDDGKFYGDYNEEKIKDIAGWYTPTPGGVGPVNVACLLENVVSAAEHSIEN